MINFIKQIYNGKTLGRILFNRAVLRNCRKLNGKVLDIAGGENPSYIKYLPEDIELIQTDILDDGMRVDMNETLPFKSGDLDSVLLFNAIYIAEDAQKLIEEIWRILKKDGRLFVVSPFMYGEMPEPHDYTRYTAEKLKLIFEEVDFQDIKIERIGGRFAAATNLLHSFFVFGTLRLVVYSIALGLDKITINFQSKYPAPIQYFVTARK